MANTVINPPPVTIQANNWFHAGWLDAALGQPRRKFESPDHPVRDDDIDAYVDGYDTGKKTGFDFTRTVARMAELGQLKLTVGYK